MEGRRGLPVLVRNRLLMEAPPGWVFFREGEPGAAMFFVLAGSVSLVRDGREIARVRKGNFFGEMTFLLGEDRSATAVALAPCRCVIIHGENFETLLLEFPGIVREMLGKMAARVRERPRTERPQRVSHGKE
jgi:CRP-like cAMP-binding protein